MKLERRATLVAAIARGRRWLDELITDSATDAQAIATRERCSLRHVNMTMSLSKMIFAVCEFERVVVHHLAISTRNSS